MDINSITNLIKHEKLIKDLSTVEYYQKFCKNLDISSSDVFKIFKDSNCKSGRIEDDLKYLYVGKKDNNYYFLQCFYTYVLNAEAVLHTSLYILENPKILKNGYSGPAKAFSCGQMLEFKNITLIL